MMDDHSGHALAGQALVSDQAPAGLAATRFGPSCNNRPDDLCAGIETARARQAKRDASGIAHVDGSIHEGMEACITRNGRTMAHVIRYADAVEIAAVLSTDQSAEIAMLREALEWYADTSCEYGRHSEVCGKLTSDDCAGCVARTALNRKNAALAASPTASDTQGMSAGTAETQSGSGLQPASPVPQECAQGGPDASGN